MSDLNHPIDPADTLRLKVLAELSQVTGDTPEEITARARENLEALHTHLVDQGIDPGPVEWAWDEVLALANQTNEAIALTVAARRLYQETSDRLHLTTTALDDQVRANETAAEEARQRQLDDFLSIGMYISIDPAMDIQTAFLTEDGKAILTYEQARAIHNITTNPAGHLTQEQQDELANLLTDFINRHLNNEQEDDHPQTA